MQETHKKKSWKLHKIQEVSIKKTTFSATTFRKQHKIAIAAELKCTKQEIPWTTLISWKKGRAADWNIKARKNFLRNQGYFDQIKSISPADGSCSFHPSIHRSIHLDHRGHTGKASKQASKPRPGRQPKASQRRRKSPELSHPIYVASHEKWDGRDIDKRLAGKSGTIDICHTAGGCKAPMYEMMTTVIEIGLNAEISKWVINWWWCYSLTWKRVKKKGTNYLFASRVTTKERKRQKSSGR